MQVKTIGLQVNGDQYEVMVKSHRTLLEVLREQLGLTGTKEACNSGECGSCTVLVDGDPVLSCSLLAWDADGHSITTVEGLAAGGQLHPLQRAFIEHGAIQCGFCTPGMLMTSKAFLDRHPGASEQEIREAIAGNLCRCTGYQKIVEAICAVAREGAVQDEAV